MNAPSRPISLLRTARSSRCTGGSGVDGADAPRADGSSARSVGPRSVLLALFTAAILLVPAAGASAFTFNIAIEGTGSGTVEGSGFSEPGEGEPTLNCSGPPAEGECEFTYGESGNANMTAVPDPGSEFVEWQLSGGTPVEGCTTGTGCFFFWGEEDITATAVFDEEGGEGFTFNIAIEGTGSGTVEGSGFSEPGEGEPTLNCSGPPAEGECEFTYGESGNANMTAVPDPGSEFVEWQLSGGTPVEGCTTGTGCFFFWGEEDITATAVFDEEGGEGFTFNIAIEGTGSGTVEGSGFSEPGEGEPTLNCSGPPAEGECEFTYGESGNANMTAVPDPGSEFVEWQLSGGTPVEGCTTGTGCFFFWGEEDITATAVFDEEGGEGFTFNIAIEGTGSGTVEGSGFSEPGEGEPTLNCSGPPAEGECEFTYGESGNANMTAVPDPGSEFVEWQLSGGTPVEGCTTGTGCFFFWGEEDITATAVFDEEGGEGFTFNIAIEGTGSGTVEGSGFSEPGEGEPTLNCSGPPAEGECEFTYGESGNANMTAVPDPGSEFVEWQLSGGTPVEGCTTGTGCFFFWGEEDITATAVFDEEGGEGFTFNIAIEGTGSGTVEGSGFSEPGEGEPTLNCSGPPAEGECEFTYGESGNANMTAVPDPGSEFVEWQLSGGTPVEGCTTGTGCFFFWGEEDITATAVFDEEGGEGFTFNIAIEGTGSGTVEGSGFSEPGEGEPTLNCSGPPAEGECEFTYGESGNANMTAVPDPGSEFVEWQLSGGTPVEGCTTGTGCFFFWGEEDITATAVFDSTGPVVIQLEPDQGPTGGREHGRNRRLKSGKRGRSQLRSHRDRRRRLHLQYRHQNRSYRSRWDGDR